MIAAVDAITDLLFLFNSNAIVINNVIIAIVTRIATPRLLLNILVIIIES
ncbi:MAG: hypothetical protein JRG74_07020 [Deltaproteobacteria bacterium]|nr:hypothetical protein [Deltaproteobacteria bacterium]